MADKTKSIKNATDKELDELIIRLRKENEVQNIIFELKRRANTNGFLSYDAPGISTEDAIESLYHFGVLGMKWGKRGSKKIGSRVYNHIKQNVKKENPSEDHKTKTNLKKKRLHEMSNAELKILNERLQLERQFKDLSSKDISAGRKFAQDILRDVAKETAKDGVKNIIKKAF